MGRLIGRWRPGHIPPWVALCVSIALAVAMLVSGWGYVQADNPALLSTVEAAAPLMVWGAGFMTAGACVLAGVVLRHGHLVWCGHFVGGCLYVGVGVGQVQVVTLGGVTPPTWLPLLGAAAVLNLLFAASTHMRIRQLELVECGRVVLYAPRSGKPAG